MNRTFWVVLVALVCLSSSVRASTIFGVNTSNRLLRFDSETPGTLTLNVAITGVGAGQTIVGSDFRPANFLLYAVTKDAGNTGRIYTLNTTTGAATLVSTISVPLNGTSFGIDFNPQVDRLRIVSEADQNLRVNVDTGVALVDGTLAFAPGDPNTATDPTITAVGYTNNFAGATQTTLYGLDPALNAIVTVNPPNNGTLNTFFASLNTDDPLGLDFTTSVIGYVSRTTGPVDSELVEIAPTPGSFGTNVKGTIGGGARILDIAIQLFPPQTFVVNTTIDANDGACTALGIGNGCTLREAILASNSHEAVDTISFNIPGGGVQTIAPASALPAFADGAIVDGYTQPGAAVATAGAPATLRIELNGAGAGGGVDGLTLTRGGLVRGLVINRFTGNGIAANSVGNCVIRGNYIGTDAGGTVDFGNGANGVQTFSNQNIIGGLTPADRNIISGNATNGVRFFAITSENVIQGNYIGTDVTGTLDLGNSQNGVSLDSGPSRNTVGGTVAGARNIISGNDANGVTINFLVDHNLVEGNYIGTDVTGTLALGNTQDGVHLENNADFNTIGGSTSAARNIISGNGGQGVRILDASSEGNIVSGNTIGLNSGGTALGNGGNGVLISNSLNNVVGGSNPQAGNIISGNAGDGVQVAAGTGNAIFGNSIFSNGGLGINLLGLLETTGAVTPNDVGDADPGPNNLQNFPVLSSASAGGLTTAIQGSLNSVASATFFVDFYANAAADPSGKGEGQTYLGYVRVTTDERGNAPFSFVASGNLAGQFVSATATSLTMDTSEFGDALLVSLPPSLSISDVTVTEGDASTSSAIFNVVLSAATAQTVTVDYVSSNGTATVPDDYQAVAGTLIFTPGVTARTITVPVVGDTVPEPSETFFVNLMNPTNASITTSQGKGTINDNDASSTFQFAAPTASASEAAGVVTLTVTRSGNTSGAGSVRFETADQTAVQKNDYTFGSGTLLFGPGETSKPVTVLLVNDATIEPGETFLVTLSEPSGNSAVGPAAVVTITNDDVVPTTVNPIDDPAFFVRQHYLDFLGRDPDASGFNFWTNEITSCGGNTQCVEVKRINVSASFFLSIEFQETGGSVLRTQRVAFGRQSSDPATRVPYLQFMRDTRDIGQGVIVGQPGFAALLEANKQAYAQKTVASAEFAARFPALPAGQYVDALYASAGVTPTAAERQAAIDSFGAGGTAGRVAALRSVADSTSVRNAEFSQAFVLLQYYGYLRRNPTDAPDFSDSGYQFWLGKLNSFNGDFVKAEMVKAFLVSQEYRGRFLQP